MSMMKEKEKEEISLYNLHTLCTSLGVFTHMSVRMKVKVNLSKFQFIYIYNARQNHYFRCKAVIKLINKRLYMYLV